MPAEIKLDWNKVLNCSAIINNNIDNVYFEYIWHRYIDNQDIEYKDWKPSGLTFDSHWLVKYYLNFIHCKDLLKDYNVLDLGCGIPFYAKWFLNSGAKSYDGIDLDFNRIIIGDQLLELQNLKDKANIISDDIESYVYKPQFVDSRPWIPQYLKLYDIVYLIESLYYIHNQHDLLTTIKQNIKPKNLIIESVVVDDILEHPEGIIRVKYSSEDSKDYDGVKSDLPRLKMHSSRKAYEKLFESTGWKIKEYYDFKNYKGPDFPSENIANGRKMFYVLE